MQEIEGSDFRSSEKVEFISELDCKFKEDASPLYAASIMKSKDDSFEFSNEFQQEENDLLCADDIDVLRDKVK